MIFFFFMYDDETNTTVPVSVDDTVEISEELEFFFDDKVRKIWHRQQEEWYFSIINVCQVLTDTPNPRKYWSVLKTRLKAEGNETATNCSQLKMKASDGKMRKTDCATTEQLLRIIQSIPSKKAEPFKQWLAMVGKERLDEMADPELAFKRMVNLYRQKGYSEKWIEQHQIESPPRYTPWWTFYLLYFLRIQHCLYFLPLPHDVSVYKFNHIFLYLSIFVHIENMGVI